MQIHFVSLIASRFESANHGTKLLFQMKLLEIDIVEAVVDFLGRDVSIADTSFEPHLEINARCPNADELILGMFRSRRVMSENPLPDQSGDIPDKLRFGSCARPADVRSDDRVHKPLEPVEHVIHGTNTVWHLCFCSNAVEKHRQLLAHVNRGGKGDRLQCAAQQKLFLVGGEFERNPVETHVAQKIFHFRRGGFLCHVKRGISMRRRALRKEFVCRIKRLWDLVCFRVRLHVGTPSQLWRRHRDWC